MGGAAIVSPYQPMCCTRWCDDDEDDDNDKGRGRESEGDDAGGLASRRGSDDVAAAVSCVCVCKCGCGCINVTLDDEDDDDDGDDSIAFNTAPAGWWCSWKRAHAPRSVCRISGYVALAAGGGWAGARIDGKCDDKNEDDEAEEAEVVGDAGRIERAYASSFAP